ncbi:hypothetical protein IIB34_06875 [PVC group bacterium]|nr:hypothetical protein [PVC group bacterium]
MSQYIINPFFEFGQAPPVATRNAWVEIARSAPVVGINQTLPLLPSPFANKRYLMLLVHLVNNTGSGTGPEEHIRFNGDAGANYSNGNNFNGQIPDSFVVNQSLGFFSRSNGFNDKWVVAYIDNNPVGEKLVSGHDNFHVTPLVSYPTSVPDRNESKIKWSNVLDPITDILVGNIIGNIAGGGIGSEAVLLGFDPADALQADANFWRELASNTLLIKGDTLSSGAFPARKYLWVQIHVKAINGTINTGIEFNSDVGANYGTRQSKNGVESTVPGQNSIKVDVTVGTDPRFYEFFIINKIDKQKLGHNHTIERNLVGAGSVPQRQESVFVWDNTVAQITTIDASNVGGGGDYEVGSTIKVWGHD